MTPKAPSLFIELSFPLPVVCVGVLGSCSSSPPLSRSPGGVCACGGVSLLLSSSLPLPAVCVGVVGSGPSLPSSSPLLLSSSPGGVCGCGGFSFLLSFSPRLPAVCVGVVGSGSSSPPLLLSSSPGGVCGCGSCRCRPSPVFFLAQGVVAGALVLPGFKSAPVPRRRVGLRPHPGGGLQEARRSSWAGTARFLFFGQCCET